MKRAAPIVIIALALAAACSDGDGTDDRIGRPRDRVLPSEGSDAPASPPKSRPASEDPPTSAPAALPAPRQGAVVRGAARPLAGGTLAITSDGALAIAADPDRAAIFVVDLATRAVRTIATEPDDEVGRVVEGPAGHAFVAARRGGVVLDVDLKTANATRIPVCRAPRGIAYAAGALHVACASGALVTVDAATRAVTRRRTLDADLRDVVVVGDRLAVTRFIGAELLMLDADGQPAHRSAILASSLLPGVPTVAYRAIAGPGGSVVVSHQAAPASANAYYDMTRFPCDGAALVRTVVSVVHPDPPAPNIESVEIKGSVLPVDVAIDGSRLAVVSGGQVRVIALGAKTGCHTDAPLPVFTHGEIVAVASRTGGGLVAQSREPAQLLFETGDPIALSETSHDSTGFSLFHASVGDGISCASCHPEGGDDGRLWRTDRGAERLSQPLYAGGGRATPYHWDGEIASFSQLLDQTMIRRMGANERPNPAQEEAFVDWLDAIRAPLPADDLDAAFVARGAAAFKDKGCASCHAGDRYTDRTAHDIGTGAKLITPALVGAGSRSAFLHDGCASSLRTVFGACSGTAHGEIARIDAATRDDLIAFLRSL